MKDQGQAWHQFAIHESITQQDLDLGKESYMRFGVGPLTNRATLAPNNVFNKCMMFYFYSMPASARIRNVHLAQGLKRMWITDKVRACLFRDARYVAASCPSQMFRLA